MDGYVYNSGLHVSNSTRITVHSGSKITPPRCWGRAPPPPRKWCVQNLIDLFQVHNNYQSVYERISYKSFHNILLMPGLQKWWSCSIQIWGLWAFVLFLSLCCLVIHFYRWPVNITFWKFCCILSSICDLNCREIRY